MVMGINLGHKINIAIEKVLSVNVQKREIAQPIDGIAEVWRWLLQHDVKGD
jgi:hypothetical protein